jgi:hypothetical protein
MISLEDCMGLCGLSEQEVDAIAEHEHLPEIEATVLAHYLMSHKQSAERIRAMLIDDIRAAAASGDSQHVTELVLALHHFLNTYPCAEKT